MTLKQLTYFLEIAKMKNFTKAAANLYISQSALSKTVKAMESELGVQLIDRTVNHFKLTPEGEIFYQKGLIAIKNINSELEDLYGSLGTEKGHITVGIPPVIGTAYFTSIIYKFRNMYPDVELKIIEAGANTIKKWVSDGEVDIGVVILPVSNDAFNVIPIVTAENVLLVNKNHPLAQYDEVSFKMLKDERFIALNSTFMLYDQIISLCRISGFEPNIVCESSQWDFITEMVVLDQGVSILPRPILKRYNSDKLKLISLKDPSFSWNIAIILKKDKYISRIIKSFIELSKKEGAAAE
jgi:DNA-binding transcriptional LysR family regulator